MDRAKPTAAAANKEAVISQLLGKPFAELSANEISARLDELLGPITEFRGAHEFLSNFAACEIAFEGIVYRSVEHAFQAAKTLDTIERHRIARLPTAGGAKRAGRALALRGDWESVKFEIMESLLRTKFADGALREKLKATGQRALIEVNTWNDRLWGAVRNRTTGKLSGQNRLGELLMKVRASL